MNQEITIVEAPSSGKKKIGFLCLPGLETFIKPITEHFSVNYDVKTYYGNNLNEIESVVGWSDLVFLEWANQLVVEATNRIPTLADKKVIVRCHSYEALDAFIPQIKWSSVSVLLFVATHIRDIAVRRFPKLKGLVKMEVVPNGI